jgi:hypothetical protein
MTRMLWVSLTMLAYPAFAEDLPVPPVPPENPPIAEAAPTPDVDARAPVTPASERPSVDVRLYRSTAPDPSFGFAPGSRFQTAEDRKPIQTPGISVTVPLR